MSLLWAALAALWAVGCALVIVGGFQRCMRPAPTPDETEDSDAR